MREKSNRVLTTARERGEKEGEQGYAEVKATRQEQAGWFVTSRVVKSFSIA